MTTSLPEEVVQAIEFEKSQWATGSVYEDPFYSVEGLDASARPGALLKVEKTSDVSLYSIPAATTLSRFVYQSKTFSGSLVPVSAYVLWPSSPRTSPDGFQVVAWAHGTSGISAENAPSHTKNLWQHFLAPYQLVCQGYVVVATDYAGLGVSKTADGKSIVHEYLALPAHANDVVYSVLAAQEAFPELSRSWVAVGHSQGGGATLAVAQRQAKDHIPGYLGAVPISPVTRLMDEADPARTVVTSLMVPGIQAAFPGFNADDILTERGKEILGSVRKYHLTLGASTPMLFTADLMKSGWHNNSFLSTHQDTIQTGGKPVAGPLLIIHGQCDELLSPDKLTSAVKKTAEMNTNASIKYIQFEGASHNGTLPASQWMWMDWIADRFKGVDQKKGLVCEVRKTAKSVDSYQRNLNWWLKHAKAYHETP
ncbi:alpha/beta-Hydrolase [Glarea lozoyensis ATCC 20868]|uniref:Alpha/beta-Hydrolase n=1 Tax=Glarea lozoyensis (strain ATCC 20868 / MF5171) TaxID=1116229 RepID=S3DM29_GLAL2|nr:alpha/beta-Hydrolase [Glarea lozoyensis ATCC 20868]EPE33126.1 alpha/beta-Hydrolase [Glarea lozoyensis ATCC 20868]